MIPGLAKVIKCPYCGAEKELMTLCSGNTIRAFCWSDGKTIFPMLPRVSPVQKCPECGRYYLEYKLPESCGEDCSFELGNMNYDEWKEAYMQFLNEDVDNIYDTGFDKNDWVIIRLKLIHAYNDRYSERGDPEEKAPKEEFDFIVGIIDDYIREHDWSKEKNPLLKAELYRESGRFKECHWALQSIDEDDLDIYGRWFKDDIKERLYKENVSAFRILNDDERREKIRRENEESERTWRQLWLKKEMQDPRWKLCQCGHCIKNTDKWCHWCKNDEVVERIDKDTPVRKVDLYVGQKEGQWVLTFNPNIGNRSERIRKITVELVGDYKHYYHLDGQNPNPFRDNIIKLGDGYLYGEELTEKCDLLLDGDLYEIPLTLH